MPTNAMPHITDGELDNDKDDANPNDLLPGPQGYVGSSDDLVNVLTTELAANGTPLDWIKKNLPVITAAANGLMAVFAPAALPIAGAVEAVIAGAAAGSTVAAVQPKATTPKA